MSSICIFLINLYRYIVSPLFPRTCRFYPSCSQYSLKAFKKYGFTRGFLLSFRRILRCHPFSGDGGFDPLV